MKIPFTLLSQRATTVTTTDKSNSVALATWILMGIFVVMFIVREAIKTVVFKKLALDDVFILVATIFGIALSVTVIVLTSEGLGVLEVLTVKRANTLMKGLYASDFLYVSSLCFAKLSLLTFFYHVLVQGVQRRCVLGFGLFILIWSIASISAIAFQCGLPRPWEILSLHCYDRGTFWVVFCIIDMTTDVSIIMLSVNLVAYLRVKFSRKVAVVACFAPRILVVVASLTRLIYIYPVNPHRNPEYRLWGPIICTQAQICLSISTACIPYMVPFFKGLESGKWRSRPLRSGDMRISDLYGWGASRKSLRSMKKVKKLDSVDSTAFSILQHERTPEVSPRLPSPRPLSPLTPPRLVTPPNSSNGSSRSPSERGLKLHIPPLPPPRSVLRTADALSPQTASSYALSPQCFSPQALLSSPMASPIRREPSPPRPSYSPNTHHPSSFYANPDATGPTTPRGPRFSLFPSPQNTRYAPLIAQSPAPLVASLLASQPHSDNRLQNRISIPRMSFDTPMRHDPPLIAEHPPRKSSLRRDTSIVPQNASSSFATIPSYYAKTPPTTHTSSSSNPLVPSYYYNTPPPASTPPKSSLPQPPSPQRVRNQRILQPQNSSRRDQISPVSPASPRTPLNFWREEPTFGNAFAAAAAAAGPSTSNWPAQRPWTNEQMPRIQDMRNSPRIVIQEP